MLRLRDIHPKDLQRLEKYHRAWMVLTALMGKTGKKGEKANGNA
ncbi:MAG: hypothetical protein WKF92_15245 [Pyrinomonadaceae bacterium]